jgi:phosphosulfolactate synthase (CoM biosynthesis protein A)
MDAAKDSWHGLKEGTEVVAHYTTKGTEDTALEIDKLGKDGLKTTDGTINDIDRRGKKLVVKSSDGVESTYRLTDRAAKDGGKDIGEGMEKGAKVTVYYAEDAGKKVAHFFDKSQEWWTNPR